MKNKRNIKVKDYSKLPVSRKAQLKDVIHTDFALLIDIGIINFIFSLPLLIVLILSFVFISSLSEYTFEKIFPITFYMGLIALIPFCICGLSKGASFNCLKKRCFNEGYLLIPTIFESIKKNALKYLLGYLFVGIAYFICSNGIIYFIFLNSNSFVKGLGIGILILYFIIQYSTTSYFINFINLYVLSFNDGMKNAFSFTLLNFPFAFLYIIAGIFIPLLLISLSIYAIPIVLLVYYLVYQSIVMLAFTLNSLDRFDKYINETNYPDYVKKGLMKGEQSCQN